MTQQLTTEVLNQLMPFGAHLGMELASATAEEVVATLEWREELTTTGGGLHGGVMMALADSAGAVAAFLNLPEGASTSTTSSSTVFLRGVRAGVVTATARPLHIGRSTIVVETTIAQDGRPVARTTQSQAVLAPAG